MRCQPKEVMTSPPGPVSSSSSISTILISVSEHTGLHSKYLRRSLSTGKAWLSSRPSSEATLVEGARVVSTGYLFSILMKGLMSEVQTASGDWVSTMST